MNPESKILQLAGLQFLTFAARGLVIPFVNLYLVSVGFSGTQIGILTSLTALVALIFIPMISAYADRTGTHRRLFAACVSGTAAAALGFVTSVSHVWLGGAALARSTADGANAALLSQLTITWLDQHRRAIYGRLRGAGSFGWAVTTFVSGRLVALGGYPLLFIIAALINFAALPLLHVLPESTNRVQDRSGQAEPRVPEFFPLMIGIFLFFVGMNAVSAFAFIYMKQELGATDDLIGMAASVAALSEVLPMILIDYVLHRIHVRHTLVAGIAGMALTWVLMAILVDTTWILPLMIFRGLVYTLQNISITLLVARISRPANVTTNQALAQVTVPGLAVLLTGSISGWIFDHAGPRVLLVMAALIGLAASVVVFAVGQRIRRNEPSPPVKSLLETPAAITEP